MGRGVNGENIFIDDSDYREMLRVLELIKSQANAVIYAFCLMPNHFHLAVKVATVPLSSMMQRILSGTARTFNHRHDREGHLFQGRFESRPCLDDRYLLNLIRYIQMNPVRAGLVNDYADWPWSSRSPMELPNLDADFDPWPKEEPGALIRPAGSTEATLAEITRDVAAVQGIDPALLRSRTKNRGIVAAKVRFAQESVRHGHRIAEIAAWLDTSGQCVSYYLRRNSTNLLA